MEWLTRLAIAGALILAGAGVYWGWNRWLLRTRSTVRQEPLRGLEGLRAGVPAVLYFTSPGCAPCRMVQRPALQKLQAELKDGLQVVEVDASAQPGLADYWGVLSVPTTFIIDLHGQPRGVNHGVAGFDRLRRQVAELASRPPGRSAAIPLPARTIQE